MSNQLGEPVPKGGPDQYGGRYPLVEPSADVLGLLRDFYLWHQAADALPPLRIDWMSGFCQECSSAGPSSDGLPGPSHPADLRVVDARNRTVFDSTLAGSFSARNWGSTHRLYEWLSGSAVCRALQYVGPGALLPPDEFRPMSAVLDERTWEVKPPRLDALAVTGIGGSSTGIVSIQAGYNVTLTPGPVVSSGGRIKQRIVVGAAAGSGAGIYTGCGPSNPPIATINGVGPDSAGNISLVTDPCSRLNREMSSENPIPGSLNLSDDCLAPCQPQDYANVYQALANLVETYKTLGARASRIRDQYQDMLDRWQAQKDCRDAAPYRAVITSQGGSILDGTASFANRSASCMTNVNLTLTITHSAGAVGVQDPNYGYIYDNRAQAPSPYVMAGDGTTTMTSVWDALDGGHPARVRFRLVFPPMGDQVVSVAVAAVVDGQPAYGNPLTVSAALRP